MDGLDQLTMQPNGSMRKWINTLKHNQDQYVQQNYKKKKLVR